MESLETIVFNDEEREHRWKNTDVETAMYLMKMLIDRTFFASRELAKDFTETLQTFQPSYTILKSLKLEYKRKAIKKARKVIRDFGKQKLISRNEEFLIC